MTESEIKKKMDKVIRQDKYRILRMNNNAIHKVHQDEHKRIIHLKVEERLKYLDKLCPQIRFDQLKRDIEELVLEILDIYKCDIS